LFIDVKCTKGTSTTEAPLKNWKFSTLIDLHDNQLMTNSSNRQISGHHHRLLLLCLLLVNSLLRVTADNYSYQNFEVLHAHQMQLSYE
jgi:uncharacterized membrane protein